MTMRTDCKNYESRQYPSGDTVRMCRLDLAPNAPWECPAVCEGYEFHMAGGGWTVGSLAERPLTKTPESVADGSAASVLDAAEDVINSAGPAIRDDVHRARGVKPLYDVSQKKWWQFWRRA